MGKPKIRFKGYTEDWEQRKVDDLTNYNQDLWKCPKKINLFRKRYDCREHEHAIAINKIGI